MKNDKKIGLALGSGGGRGLAHIGVIKSLVKNNIPIDFIAGSSIGAIIGGLYAATGSVEKLEKIANSVNFKNLLKTIFKKSSGKNSLFDKKFNLFFEKIIGDVKIEDLKIPYCAVGSDLITGKVVILNKGSLINAMKASCAIPIIFKPVKIDDKYIFDGGMISPVPVEIVKQTGAGKIIGVSLYGGIFPIKLAKDKRMSKIKAGIISRFLSLKRLADVDLSSADVSIELNIPEDDYRFFSKFIKNRGLIDCGFKETEKMIGKIKKII
ncbi:MAG TPA: patatin-like phospholipase family protein [Candidatus Woesebacteria bacterium]|nr:patatin-like phospholipase family protein [Candidatus Woesebacteria bacterium]